MEIASVMKKDSLTNIADEIKTDKGALRWPHHGYTFTYEMLFQHLRDKPISVLELGLAKTSQDYRGRSELRTKAVSPSVEMWQRYFPKSHVTGFDLSDFSSQESERFSFIKGDLGKASDYDVIISLNRKFEIIVDDGSHASFHQMLAFSKLFPLLNDGGFYIIEDLISQPKTIEEAKPTSHTMALLFREFLRLGYFPETSPIIQEEFNQFLGQINNVLLIPYHNLNGGNDQLCILHKKEGTRFHHYRTKIRFFRSLPALNEMQSLELQTSIDAENPYSYYWLSLLMLENKDLEKAWEYACVAAQNSPYDLEIAALQGKVLIAQGRNNNAVDFAISKMTNEVSLEVVGLQLAQDFITAQSFDSAILLLEKILKFKSDLSHGIFLLGKCYESKKSFEKSLSLYMKAIEILPSKLIYLKAYSRVSRFLNNKDAILFAEQFKDYYDNKSGYHVMMAMLYFHFKEFDFALQEAEFAKNDPVQIEWVEKFRNKVIKAKSLL